MRPTKMSSECRVYYVLYRSSEKNDLVKQTFNSVGPHLIDGLRPHVVYAYRVQAYYGLIPGAVSSTVKERTFPGERPATPYDFKLVPMIKSLKLLWKLPDGQSATVENYFIWLDDAVYFLENENKTEFILINLRPCRFYTVELVAVSAASIKSGKVTASGSPLSEKTASVPDFVVLSKPNGLLIKWIITDPQLQKISYSKILLKIGTWSRIIQTHHNVKEVLVDKLKPCHFYIVGVTTTILRGMLNKTSWKCGTPMPQVIGQPRRVKIYNLDSGKQQVISWRQPAKLPSKCHIYYLLHRTSEGGENDIGMFTSVGPHLIDGLSPSQVYSYRVQACSDLMLGAITAVVEERTLAGATPPTPYDFKLIAANRSLKMIWKLPEEKTSTVHRYLFWLDGVVYSMENQNKMDFDLVDLERCHSYIVELAAVSTASVISEKVAASGIPLSDAPCDYTQKTEVDNDEMLRIPTYST
ncbi:hypothetical protein EG68_05397 [Paragonimus skrjabini miyazakii]|uniref:Fibronectin type-III domain-containing protein n=1 Tax=Paragonimus skrjabini miyazakii TaxID=59628 RepID=A0A8S9YVW9_9TREM|nr:hypothetical protein EG68_05397 [Paragonimus skrjabini miyazakii]